MKTITEFPDYAITKDGRVWSRPRIDFLGRKRKGQWLKPTYHPFGYVQVCLCKNGKVFTRRSHHLVLETYVGPCPTGMEFRHLDGDPTNNHISNLKWGTHVENEQDKIANNTYQYGERNGSSKLTEEQVRVIFHAYWDGYYTQRELAKAFNICQQSVSAIAYKRRWKYLWQKRIK